MRGCSNVPLAIDFAFLRIFRNTILRHKTRTVGSFGIENHSLGKSTFTQYSSFARPQKSLHEKSSHGISLGKLETALKGPQVDKALEAFTEFKRLHGFPSYSLINTLITKLLYSTESKWLLNAFDLALLVFRKNSGLLRMDVLTKLCLSLARVQMPIQALTIVRIMLNRRYLPSMDILHTVVLHMVKTETGTILASNILIEICDFYQGLKAPAKLMKPDVTIFNLVMNACVNFGSYIKGQEIIEVMAKTRVVADAHSIIIIAQIYEKIYMRDELQRFKRHIDSVHAPLRLHYARFYDCLLTLHFINDDIDAASALILDVYKDHGSKLVRNNKKEPLAVPLGSSNLNTGLRLLILPDLLDKDSVLKEEGSQKLLLNKNGKIVVSNKAHAKLIVKYKRHGVINKLSNLLCSIKSELSSSEFDDLCSEVVGACLHLGWLETAHDILDDLGPEWNCAESWYFSLLNAYYNNEMFKEGDALLTRINTTFSHMGFLDSKVRSNHFELGSKSFSSLESDLAECIIQAMKEEEEEEEEATRTAIHDLNSSIYFFVKAKMIEDALTTYRRMHEMKVRPTVVTFACLLSGYSSLGMYRDITILWGDIKRNMEDGNTLIYRDLHESLLLNFIRGGYFECILEVIAYMMKKGMCLDKWLYKSEYLKFHKNLYRTLRACNARNEVQAKRLEHVQTFRKLVGVR